MNGDKTGKALGVGVFKLGDEEYDTKLGMGDVREYVKKLKSYALKLNHYATVDNLTRVDELSNSLLDFKENFVKKALIQAGMDASKAAELCGFHYQDVIKDGNIELWLGFITKKDLEDKEKPKN